MYTKFRRKKKMKRKLMALALAAAMTVSMTSVVFAADEIKSADAAEAHGLQLL
jgi:uncharacterized membrane protein